MPTIRDLLLAYKDRTGDSFEDMARKVNHGIHTSRFGILATEPPKSFPKHARTIELLAKLLDVPVTTIVLSFAASLGIPVTQSGTVLERTLPPGTDNLTAEDREAIRAVTRALVDARQHGGSAQPADVSELHPPRPDLSRVAARRGKSRGRMIREEQDRDNDTP